MAGAKYGREEKDFSEGSVIELVEVQTAAAPQEVCCGGAPPPKTNPLERPGYTLKPFVRAFIKDSRSDVALVKTELDFSDHIGTLLARLGINRDEYRIAPGLYGVGYPGQDSPVIVTANYKLTFDFVRRELAGLDCWILVLDTCGINVWCAAGKRTFSTEEIVHRIKETGLSKRVNHRRVIVPQLGASGIAAHDVRKRCGFRVVYGPVKAVDLKAFLENDMQATEKMRTVTFTFGERLELIPVEFYLFGRKVWWVFPLLFVISGISPDIFSPLQGWQRGILVSSAALWGGICGMLIVPLLLPWIPGRAFSLKGALLALATTPAFVLAANLQVLETTALTLVITSISSHLAMNFTGSTPYTSPSGVEKEMKRALPLQGLALAAGIVMWLAAPFVNF